MIMGNNIKKYLLTFLLIMGSLTLAINNNDHPISGAALDAEANTQATLWVENVFTTMTHQERLAQLMMIRAHSDKTASYHNRVGEQVKKYQLGGVCFFQGTPEKQAELTNLYQSYMKKVPLMVSMDAEWGLGMRMKASTVSYPRQLTLGAIQDNKLLYDMGLDLARQCRRLGVHINFAPVADVNNNPENPVINNRSFGEDRYNVAAKTYMYMKGMQDGNLMACAKHFPGHGDTDVDSHHDLPIINHAQRRLDSIELFPFRVLSQQGIASMMVGHLHVPVLDNRANRPTTLSQNTVTKLLRDSIGYEGLIFTDALDMRGVTKYHKPGAVEAEALLAGVDVLLLPGDIPAAFKKIDEYIEDGKLSVNDIYNRVKKVLRAKYFLGLEKTPNINIYNLRSELNSPESIVLKRKMIEQSLTLVHNKQDLIPVKETKQKFGSLALGSISRTHFQKMLSNYAKVDHYNSDKNITASRFDYLFKKLRDKDVVFISLHDMSSYAGKKFGVTSSERNLIEALRKETKVVLTVFGSPYSLAYFDAIDWVLEAYEEDQHTQELAAQGLFGVFSFSGRLPVTASAKSRFGTGTTTNSVFRIGYDIPESVGLNSEKLGEIDQIIDKAIKTRATPGAVVLVAKDGKIVFNKAYGHHTYSRRKSMSTDDIFDLASVTKIAASTLSVMKLHEDGKINIYEPISNYLTELKTSNKADLTIYDIMAHRAGLKAWIPFFEQTVTKSRRNPRPKSQYYSKRPTGKYTLPVTDKLYMNTDFKDSIWQQIYRSPLRATKDYKYSDLGFYLIAALVQRVTGQSIDQYTQETFYEPMGLRYTTYNPRLKFDVSQLVPTEEDKYFRRQRIQGHVHDMGAAMLGGISGHAGLFSTSDDLAAVFQLLLNGGYYGGKQYLQPSTIRTFTTRHEKDTRRGIGFDMKELSPQRSQNMSPKASDNTFGHLGFTGISVWSDPEYNLTYVFLSNRTYPSMHNYKLSTEDYRPRIQTVIYEAME